MPSAIRVGAKAVCTWLLVAIAVVFILGPFLWLVAHAFVTSWTYPRLWPDGFTLHWWSVVFSDSQLQASIGNSLFFAPVTVALSSLVCLPAAYAFSRFNFPGRRIFQVSLLAVNAFPKMGLYVAMAAIFYGLHLMESISGILIIHLISTLVNMTWIPAAAFSSVPKALEEAAADAGAGKLRVFCSVTLPIAAPGILVAMVMSFLASFDESQGTYLVGAPKYMTMPTQMYSMVLNYPEQVSAVFALILAVPSVVLLLVCRKYIMGGRLAEGFQIR
ncbi:MULTISPECIES: ABC transporter permease [Bifidobacterium]|jgi:putative spermidine/putrescine transport system permease protein|uniref:ABC transporter permease subunit n=1 Tax=Bifidobacterium tibiigranuli TaxID=2172043 RepID=A0A5N6S353_9BIFI|nr:ABC transporter permease subunit [Bifidobacterium tibiigranuli]KAE8128794.1 ABC transporter permease subunit [Bifidobacterium tibiigranuli]KAE8128985.1 carbohydrate ABC transporter permease [Bifidobacterium tibiigranuli]MCH3973615.1 ABC transporter permease subunit [Bifidobacterium tibiigranuli]MCH4189727.1 ABC transporter permease subunit [Bifidobacterium tibiigranuli]MCH4204640.1 ABC transporter permease subunit [Bifidobacterium tibiigranuli]